LSQQNSWQFKLAGTAAIDGVLSHWLGLACTGPVNSQPGSSVPSGLSYFEQASLFCRLPKPVEEQALSFSLAMLLVISALKHLHMLACLGLQYTSGRTE